MIFPIPRKILLPFLPILGFSLIALAVERPFTRPGSALPATR